MSGTIAVPDSISITTVEPDIEVSITPPGGVTLPAGVPVFPLANDPSQTWNLEMVNGVLTWVQYVAPPGEGICLLEDSNYVWALEDDEGIALMEAF
jgi:hypothetical protein